MRIGGPSTFRIIPDRRLTRRRWIPRSVCAEPAASLDRGPAPVCRSAVLAGNHRSVDGLRQVEDLVREMEQLVVLLVLVLHRLPLLVRQHLAFLVRAVLADHHEGREEDRLERDDHRQQPVRIGLDSEPDPGCEPDDVEIHELHRAAEGCDAVGDAILDAGLTPLRMLDQRRVHEHGHGVLLPPHAQAPPLRASRRTEPRSRSTTAIGSSHQALTPWWVSVHVPANATANPAATRQSSPTMKFHQKRPNATTYFTPAPPQDSLPAAYAEGLA